MTITMLYDEGHLELIKGAEGAIEGALPCRVCKGPGLGGVPPGGEGEVWQAVGLEGARQS